MASRQFVRIGSLEVGGGNPIRVESMLTVPLVDRRGCRAQLEALAAAGCELVRTAYTDVAHETILGDLAVFAADRGVALMADIHFNAKLAESALAAGCPSIRVNPGNMADTGALRGLLAHARDRGAVVRIGANGGSLRKDQLDRAGGDRALALFQVVEDQLRVMQQEHFDALVLSAKASNVRETVRANALLAQKYPQYPLHIGITEAGAGMPGAVKSSCGLALMLMQGIGDTLRVSLTGDPCEEVRVGYALLQALELRMRGIEWVSCPTCGRARIDVAAFLERVRALVPEDLEDGFKFAVMGCEVNGPREAADADMGIAGTPDGFVLFRKGVPYANGKTDELEQILGKSLQSLVEKNGHRKN